MSNNERHDLESCDEDIARLYLKTAASQIKTLISTSNTLVGEGVHLVGKTGQALDRIGSKVVEIESKLTNANKRKKEAQFRDTVTGVEIIIINLAENKHQDSIIETVKFLEERL